MVNVDVREVERNGGREEEKRGEKWGAEKEKWNNTELSGLVFAENG